jgi:hypothetical protein
VFENLRQLNLMIEPDLCEFLKIEISYLGHVVTSEGVRPDPEKIKAIINFPTPKNATDIISFLGLAGYYRKFIPQFSNITKPLNDLLKKNQKWQWEAEQIESFRLMRIALTHKAVLKFSDFTQPFVVTTHASGLAVGAKLSQGKIGQDKPTAYASMTLTREEINYSTIAR